MPPTHTDEGLRAAVEARAAVPGTAVLVVSQYVEVAYADELLADGRGGGGYLLKGPGPGPAPFPPPLARGAGRGNGLGPQGVGPLFARRPDRAPAGGRAPPD